MTNQTQTYKGEILFLETQICNKTRPKNVCRCASQTLAFVTEAMIVDKKNVWVWHFCRKIAKYGIFVATMRNLTFSLQKMCNDNIFVAKMCKYVLIDNFQGQLGKMC